MKRFQVFGKSLYNAVASNEDDSCRTEIDPIDPKCTKVKCAETSVTFRAPLNLMGLPSKILLMILQNLDRETLLNLCVVNSKLYSMISNDFLYKNVVMSDRMSLLKFNAVIHSEFHTTDALCRPRRGSAMKSQNIRFLVSSIEFVNPECQDSLLKYSKLYKNDGKSLIGGSYTFDAKSHSTTECAYMRPSHQQQKEEAANGLLSKIISPKKDTVIAKGKNTRKGCEFLDKWEVKYLHYTYIELLLDIIDYLPNLSKVILSEVSPNFKIPLWYSVFNDGSKDFYRRILKGTQSMTREDLKMFELNREFINSYDRKLYALPRLKTIEIRASLDSKKKQQVVFRPNLVCCFGLIDEIKLKNIVIDTESLDTPFEFIPLHMKKDETGKLNLHATFRSLTLDNCFVVPGNGIFRLFHDYFKCVRELELLSINSKYDLLLSSCFVSLRNLTIDCNSNAFINETAVSDNYYYKNDQDAEVDTSLDVSDTATLNDIPADNSLQAPPPTSAIIAALNLQYIPRKAADSNAVFQTKLKPGAITKQQCQFFSCSSVPQFHYFFHNNKHLWDRLPHKNVNITIINIPFTNVFPMAPDQFWQKQIFNPNDDQETLIAFRSDADNAAANDLDKYYWVNQVKKCARKTLEISKRYPNPNLEELDEAINKLDHEMINNFHNYKNYVDIPHINFWCFLKSLSRFKSVQIKMLRKWQFCTPRTRYDWEILFKPVLKVNVPLEVRDRNGFALFTYGGDYFKTARH